MTNSTAVLALGALFLAGATKAAFAQPADVSVEPQPAAQGVRQQPQSVSANPSKRIRPGQVRRVQPEPNATKPKWYGGELLGVDAISVLTMPIGVGVAGYVLGAPIIHWTRGHVGRGFASLGLRTALPLGAGALGIAVADGLDGCGDYGEQRHPECGLGTALLGGAVGVLVGIVTASSIDAAVFAWEPPQVSPQRENRPAPRLRVGIDPNRQILSVTGTL